METGNLAKAWLLALIEDGTLEDAARIDTAAFARQAPSYCAALLAALAEDVALPAAPADTRPLRRVIDARLDELLSGGAPDVQTLLAGLAEPFVLLAAELTWRHGDAAAAAARLERHLPPGGRLLDAAPGRWWLILPGTEPPRAREVAAALGEDGAVAFGLAACPHDGADPEALMAHADEMLLAARAAGLPVS